MYIPKNIKINDFNFLSYLRYSRNNHKFDLNIENNSLKKFKYFHCDTIIYCGFLKLKISQIKIIFKYPNVC